MLFEYLDDIELLDIENDKKSKLNIKQKLDKLNFKCVNGTFNKKEIYINKKRKVIEWDIFIENINNEMFYIKTPLLKVIKNEYPYITFEILYAFDNIQIKLFEYILDYLKEILKNIIPNKSDKYIFEPLIHRSYEKKIITLKFIENYSKCFLRNNDIVFDNKNFFNNFENKSYIICLALHKIYIDIENGIISFDWNISQIKSLNIEPEIVLNKFFTNSLNQNVISHPIPPPPPPLPPIFKMDTHKIVIQKSEIVKNIKKKLPNSDIIVPSLSDIQKILEIMRKKKSPN